VGDFGAGFFVSEKARREGEDSLGATPLDEWNPEANPFA
jgi:hypothetical protein